MKLKKGSKRSAFTLMEVLVVIIILGVIIALVTTSILNFMDNLKDKSYDLLTEVIENGAELYLSGDIEKVTELVQSEGYYMVTLAELASANVIDERLINPKNNEEIPLDKKVYLLEENNKIIYCFEEKECMWSLYASIQVDSIIGEVTSNSIQVIGSVSNSIIDIENYSFSKDNGNTWTSWQTNNTYLFTNLTTGTYQIKTRVKGSSDIIIEGDAVSETTTAISSPTYSVIPSGWAQSKTVTINYQTTSYTKEYSTNGGSTWTTATSQTENVVFNANGSVIARITDGVNIVTASVFNVSQIDTTPPLIATATIGTITTGSLQVIGYGEDEGSGVSQYAFSSDNGTTWTAPQGSNTYTFTGLTNGSYNFRVRVIDGVGLTLDSASVNQTLASPNQPASFIMPTSDIEKGETITVNWGATSSWGTPSTDQNYRLEVQYNGGSWNLVANTGTTTTYNHTVSSSHNTIRYRVRGENTFGSSSWRYSSTLNLIGLFTSGTFTNCGQTGNTGPNQTQCNNTYVGSELEGEVTVTNGIQYWTVPTTGTYRIEAWGAQGGGTAGGLGARIRGDVNLTAGQVLKIMVGQQGGVTTGTNRQAISGGGGTFVALEDNTPLIVAGGGGGSATTTSACNVRHGTTSTNGNSGANGSSNLAGGTNGNGATSHTSYSTGGGGLLTSSSGTATRQGKGFIQLGAGGEWTRNGGFGGGGSAYHNYNDSCNGCNVCNGCWQSGGTYSVRSDVWARYGCSSGFWSNWGGDPTCGSECSGHCNSNCRDGNPAYNTYIDGSTCPSGSCSPGETTCCFTIWRGTCNEANVWNSCCSQTWNSCCSTTRYYRSGAAGGGGYSGGGSSSRSSTSTSSNICGGGGGSYNAGSNQSNSSGVRSGHGQVVITYLP